MKLINNPMKKRGQVELVIGVILLIGIVGVGLYGTIDSISNSRYIVDITGNVVYDLAKCPISKINQTNLVYISDIDAETKQKLKEGTC